MISWLLQPLVQIVDKNGNPVVGAKVYVYYSTPETLATIYSDDSGTVQENPVLTDTLGNVTIFADTEYLYDVIVYDPNGNLLFGKKHIAPASLLDVTSNEVKVEAGEGINVTKTVSEGQITYTVSCDFDVVALEANVAQKQDKLEAGQNIEITNQNIINVTGRKSFVVHSPLKINLTDNRAILSIDEDILSPVSAGTDLKIEDNVVSVDTNGVIESGEYNFIAGYNTWVSGNHNILAGANISIKGGRNAVFGGNNTVEGYSNSVGGYTNNISGAGINVVGLNNNVSGQADAVFGYNNKLSGDYTFVVGREHIVSGESNTVVGKSNRCNNCKDDFIGGSYTSADNLNESFVYGYKNDIKSSRTGRALNNVIGNNNIISGDNVYVLGDDNTVTGTSNYIIGSHNSADSYNGTQACGAVGDYNKVSQMNSYSFGNRLSANNNEILIGLGPSSTTLNFSGTYLKITTAGLFKVVNGVQTQL